MAIGACPVALGQGSRARVREDHAQFGEAVDDEAFAEYAGERNRVLRRESQSLSACVCCLDCVFEVH